LYFGRSGAAGVRKEGGNCGMHRQAKLKMSV